MSDQGGGLPPAGWYPDPEVPGGQRYWDGERWGEQRPPAQDPGAWQTPPPSAWGGSHQQQPSWQSAPNAGQPAWSTGAVTGVDPWLWQSIVATVLCCLPIGIVGIVKSSQARTAMDIGNGPLARQRANEARTWTLVSVGLGLVGYVFYFAVVVGLGAAV